MRYLIYIICCFSTVAFSKNLKAQNPTIGLIQNKVGTQPGYTLIAPAGRTTYLIDNCGREINSWVSEYPLGGRSYLTESGLLLRSGKDETTPISLGGESGILELFDWDGNLVWRYFYSDSDFVSHHDMTPLPNGNILVLAAEIITGEEAAALGRDPDLVQDELYIETVVEIQPVGTSEAEIVWKWSISDHLVQDYNEISPNFGVVADHPELMDFNFTPNGFSADWIHLNGLDYNEELDQIAFSSRFTDEFYIIDHSTTTAEAASHTGGNSNMGGDFLYRWGNPIVYDRGTAEDRRLYAPHDINWIKEGFPNAGELIIFNNGVGRPGGNYSTADRISPPINSEGLYDLELGEKYLPEEPDVAFEADPPSSFYATNTSGVEQLENGNYLLCHGPRGILLEANSVGEITWEYINPVTNSGPQAQGTSFPLPGNSLFSVSRYSPNFSGLEGFDLTPGLVLETDPYDSDCMIISSTENTSIQKSIILSPNPATSEVQIRNFASDAMTVKILNLQGQVLYSRNFNSPNPILNLEHLSPGLYFIEVQDEGQNKISVERFIKI